MKFSPLRVLIPVVLIGAFGATAWYVSAQRARQRSVLSGYFDSQPAELASRLGRRGVRLRGRGGGAVGGKASLAAAHGQETLGRKDAERMQTLYQGEAISAEQLDREGTDYQEGQARRREQKEAYRCAEEGTPAEETEQARQAYRQA